MDDTFKNMPIDPSIMKQILSTPVDYSKFMPPIPKPPEITPIPLREHIANTEEYQKNSLQILQSIEQNTANLYVLVELLNKSVENQDDLISLVSEILSMSKAKTKEDADSFYRKVMGKINATVKDAESMMKIVTWATSVYNMICTMFQK